MASIAGSVPALTTILFKEKTMNAYEKRAMITASGQVLCEDLPEDFDDPNWSDEDFDDIDDWVVSNAWQPFEYWSAKQLWEQIDSVAYTLKYFHANELEISLNEVQ